MRYQLNSILNKRDGIFQLSALVGLRALLPRFWNQFSRSGPFVLTLPDMHQSNIFVDDDWNVTRLIDLEFAPVQPVQMAHVPMWLSGQGVDELEGPHLDEYATMYDRFVDTIEQEESANQLEKTYSQGLRDDWITGRFWYVLALNSINGFPAVFKHHLRPMFFETFKIDTDGQSLTRLWDKEVWDFIDGKLKDNEQYKEQIRKIFVDAKAREIKESDAGIGNGTSQDAHKEKAQPKK